MNSDAEIATLRSVLERASEELRDNRLDLLAVEELLTKDFERMGKSPATPQEMAHLQKVDLVAQCLGELANFLDRLSIDLKQDLQVDVGPALSGLCLVSLADRLRAREDSPAADRAHQDAGVVQLF